MTTPTPRAGTNQLRAAFGWYLKGLNGGRYENTALRKGQRLLNAAWYRAGKYRNENSYGSRPSDSAPLPPRVSLTPAAHCAERSSVLAATMARQDEQQQDLSANVRATSSEAWLKPARNSLTLALGSQSSAPQRSNAPVPPNAPVPRIPCQAIPGMLCPHCGLDVMWAISSRFIWCAQWRLLSFS